MDKHSGVTIAGCLQEFKCYEEKLVSLGSDIKNAKHITLMYAETKALEAITKVEEGRIRIAMAKYKKDCAVVY